jgi:hypothetical protein
MCRFDWRVADGGWRWRPHIFAEEKKLEKCCVDVANFVLIYRYIF